MEVDKDKIKLAIHILKKYYGVVGLKDVYLLAIDIDGDLRIKPMGLLDKSLWDHGLVSPHNFIKINDLIKIKQYLERPRKFRVD